MKIGDVSRARRFADPARQRWYAFHRAVRFAVRMRQDTNRTENSLAQLAGISHKQSQERAPK